MMNGEMSVCYRFENSFDPEFEAYVRKEKPPFILTDFSSTLDILKYWCLGLDFVDASSFKHYIIFYCK